tara:strand:+ start:966 stop:1835 length:870 start_codon:yes stop_codon:yes gene_type:complete
MSEEATNSGTVEAAEQAEAPTLAENIEASSGAPPIQDEYEQRVEAILKHHEKKKEHQKQNWQNKKEEQNKSYENVTLQEGESWDSVYSSMPESVQRAMGSLRADYTRKMQALSQERRKVEDLQSSLTNSEAFKALQSQAQAAAAEGQEFDPFDNKSMENYINSLVAQKLQAVLEPMYQEQMKAQSSRKVDDFMNEHPELRTDESLRKEVYELLKSDDSLNLEQGYWIVSGKRAKQSALQQQQQQKQRKEINRQVAARIGSGKKSGMTAPPEGTKMSAQDIYEYLLAQKK